MKLTPVGHPEAGLRQALPGLRPRRGADLPRRRGRGDGRAPAREGAGRAGAAAPRADRDEHREREAILKNTLLTAQKVAEDIRETARKEAETIVKQAELQGDRLLELAQNRAHEVERGILELRGHRTALRTDIRALVTRLTHLLDLQEEAEVEDNLRFLKRREEASGQ